MRLLIFGTGLFYQNRKKYLIQEEITAFADNDPAKQGKYLDGVEIIAPGRIKDLDYDYICIMTRPEYAKQIKKQLADMGILSGKILDFYMAKTMLFTDSNTDTDSDDFGWFDFTKEPGRELKRELNIVPPELALMTIVTPYYNAGKYFEQTFRSVMNQTFPWFEWIIVDDGSSNSYDIGILKDLVNRDKRICVISAEHKGVSNARNIGFKNAKTEIVVPLDADDLISPQYLEYLYFGLYYNEEAAWGYGGCVGFFGMQYLWHKPWDAEKMKTENLLVVTAAIRKKDWEEAGGYKTEKVSYSEDWRFWMDMLAGHKKPVRLGGYHFWYRRTATGRLSKVRKESERQIIEKAAKQADGDVQAVNYPVSGSKKLYQKQKDIEWDNRRIVEKKKGVIRVLMMIPWMVMGGADQFNLDLVKGLDQKRYEISMMTTIPGSNEWTDRFAEYTDEIFHLPDFLDPVHYLGFVKYYVRTRQIDFLFISNTAAGYYMLPALRKAFPELRIIDYVHMEEWYWKAGGHARTSGMMGSIIDRTYVCNSATRNVLTEYFGRKPESVKTLYIGVDEEQFCSSKTAPGYLYKRLGVSAECPIVLFPCRIHPQKRPFMVLEIAKRLADRHPEVVFAIVGDGPQLADVRSEIAERKLEQNVKCIGRCNDMAACYKDAYLTLICSVKEGLALTAYESCSMGVPVISSAVGGQGDLIDDSVGKLIEMRQKEDALDDRSFDEEETGEYIEAICELLEQKERYQECSVQCRKKIAEKFSSKKMVENMEYELEDLMSLDIRAEHETKARQLNGLGWIAEELYMLATVIEERDR